MKLSGWSVLVYGVLNILGGILGFQRANSVLSLIFGITFGLLLLGSSIAMFNNKTKGLYFSLALTFILDAFFSYRFLTKLKFMPSGMMSLVSLAVFIILTITLRQLASRKERSV